MKEMDFKGLGQRFPYQHDLQHMIHMLNIKSEADLKLKKAHDV